jgi:hypothetical protein
MCNLFGALGLCTVCTVRFNTFYYFFILVIVGRDSSVGIATRYGMDGPGIESRWRARFSAPVQTGRPWGLPSLLYNGYWVSPGGKAAGAWRGVDHPPHLVPPLEKEYSYTSTAPLSLHGLFLGDLNLTIDFSSFLLSSDCSPSNP